MIALGIGLKISAMTRGSAWGAGISMIAVAPGTLSAATMGIACSARRPRIAITRTVYPYGAMTMDSA